MKLGCIIVDDESLAQNVLETYISSVSTLHLLKKCNSALEAISYLHENKVDLIFLDINMPELSGLEMLKTLTDPPQVILTTAYSEYALESYDYGVADYLLKPFSLERFLKAVNRVTHKFEPSDSNKKTLQKSNKIILRQDKVIHSVSTEDIEYVKAYGNYLSVFTKAKKYIVRDTISAFEQKLSRHLFVRVHKSYVVQINKISTIDGNRLYIGDTKVPIGNYYKQSLKLRLED